MPNGTHSVELQLPIETIWKFVSNMNNWAPLVPGYITHEILSETQSTWQFTGDLGFMKKDVELQIDIQEWIEPTKVTFKLKGLSDQFNGGGYFEAEKISDSSTRMTGSLDITADGMMGSMVNTILKNFVPETAKEFTEAVAAKITEIENTTT